MSSGFLTGVVSIVDHEGKRVDTPNVDGDHAPVELQLGSTMTATKTTNGSLTRVTLNATGGEGGIVLALDTHDDFRELDIVDVPDGTVIHFKDPVGVFVYEDSLGAGQVDEDRTILKLDAVSLGSNGRAYSVDAPSLPTIAALRLAVSGKNEAIQVQTFATDGDEGGGHFIRRMGSATDNGGTIIVPSGVTAFYYERQFTGALNVRWFGAAGDVVPGNPPTGTDDSAAFVAVLAAAKDLEKDVFIPAGKYKIFRQPLTIAPYTRIFGEGWDSSIIWYTGITFTGSPGGTMVILHPYLLFNCEPNTDGPESDPKQQNLTFEDFQICGDNGPSILNPDAEFVWTDGAAQAGHAPIYINELGGPSADVHIHRMKILNTYGFIMRSDGNGLRKVITDCVFERNAGNCNPNGKEVIFSRNLMRQCWGVEVAGSRVDISNNQLFDMAAGISIGGDGGYAEGEFIDDYDSATKLGAFGVRVCDNLIDGCYATPEALGGTGMAFSVPLNGAIIARNVILNCEQHGIIQTEAFGAFIPSYCLIIDNIVQSVGNIGIWIGQGGTHNVISRNKVTSNSNTNRGGLTTATGFAFTSGFTAHYVITDNQARGWNVGYTLDNCTNVTWRNNKGSVQFAEGNGPATFLQDGSTQTVAATGSTNITKLTTVVDVTANGSVTVVLPSPVHMGARWRTTINNAGSQAGTTTIDSSAGTIDGTATISLVGAYQSVTVESDGTNYRVVGGKGADGAEADLAFSSLGISGDTSFGFAGASADITLTNRYSQFSIASDGADDWIITLKNTGATQGDRIDFSRTDTVGEPNGIEFKNNGGTTLLTNLPIAGAVTPSNMSFVFNGSNWIPFGPYVQGV